MTRTDIRNALYSIILKTNQDGSGYVLGEGYNANWFKALDELKESKKVVIRAGKAFTSKQVKK